VSEDDQRPVAHKPESDEWPALVRRVVSDLSRIVQTEFRLFQAGLSPILSTAIDRLVGNALALAAFIVGGICLLAATVVFLQRWVGWDAALLITGVVSLAAGYGCSRVATMRANRALADMERSFEREPAQGSQD
jgi:hypothetical protein